MKEQLSRPKRRIRLPDRLTNSPVIQNQHEMRVTRNTTVRDYQLNHIKSINKKIDACKNNAVEVLIASGNNIVIKFSTATYEIFRRSLSLYMDKNQSYCAINETVEEKNGLIVEEVMKVMNRTMNGKNGKQHKYTINLYHTKCKILVNGKESRTLLDLHLPEIKNSFRCDQQTIDILNKEIEDSLCTLSSNLMEKHIRKSRDKNPDTLANQQDLSNGSDKDVHLSQLMPRFNDKNNQISLKPANKSIKNIEYELNEQTGVKVIVNSDPTKDKCQTDMTSGTCICPLCELSVSSSDQAIECSDYKLVALQL